MMVPVVPGRPGVDERMVRLGDGVPLDRTPPPRIRPAAVDELRAAYLPFGRLCGCGVRGHRCP